MTTITNIIEKMTTLELLAVLIMIPALIVATVWIAYLIFGDDNGSK